jgi:hypothetical protein
MSSVYPQTINKYACGDHGLRTNIDIKLFSFINDCLKPNDINMLIIPMPKDNEISKENKTKYNKIYNKLSKENEWEQDVNR